MHFVLLFSLLFTVFSYSQLNKVVARKSCNVDEPCPANSYGSGLKWSGITIYDWRDHDNDPSSQDILGWSSCVKATVANSGSASVITEDHCTCRTNFTKNHLPNCVGRRSCACICVPQSCTGTRSCRVGAGTERGTGERDCISGNCNVTSWDTSDCRICTEQSCTVTRRCRSGTGTERARGRRRCVGGVLQSCGRTGAWDTSQCRTNPPPCTPRSCTPRKQCPGSGAWIYGDTNSGRRECDSSGNLSSVCTGGTYSASCPSCTSDSDCERCEECSGGQCVGKTDREWSPPWDPYAPANCGKSKRQFRCINGVLNDRNVRGDACADCSVCQERNRNNMCVPKSRGSQPTGCGGCRECNGRGQCVSKANCCTSDSQCGACKRCSGNQCVARARGSQPTGCTGCTECNGRGQCVSKANCCTSNSQCGACKRCSSGRCVAIANCCTSDSQCGVCKRCSGGRCVNRARHSQPSGCSGCKECRSGGCQNKPPTAWQPSLGKSCGTVTQKRCYGGVLRTRNKPGTKRCSTCQQCNSSGQCVNKRNSWTAWSPPWTPSRHCPDKTQLQKRTGCIGGVEKKYPDRGSYRTLTGSKRPQDCCRPQSCTPRNKRCASGNGTRQCSTGQGKRKCIDGQLSSECVCTGSWSSCPRTYVCSTADQCRENGDGNTCCCGTPFGEPGTCTTAASCRGGGPPYRCRN